MLNDFLVREIGTEYWGDSYSYSDCYDSRFTMCDFRNLYKVYAYREWKITFELHRAEKAKIINRQIRFIQNYDRKTKQISYTEWEDLI